MAHKSVTFSTGVGDVKKEKSDLSSPKLSYCEVCEKWIHTNDKKNHFNGNKHNFRFRKQTEAQRNENAETKKFKCDICKTKFTDEGFYQVHIGSKTHKRNLRRLQRQQELLNASSSTSSPTTTKPVLAAPFIKPQGRRMVPKAQRISTIEEITDVQEYVYHREKYRPRNMKTDENHYKSYIHSVTAYWALSLAVDPNIHDYKISVNDKEWKLFGDVIIEISFLTGERTTYVIQFKQISNNVKNIDSLTEGKFNFEKLVGQLVDLNAVENLKAVKFVIFTTATPTSNFEKSVTLKSSLFKKNFGKVPDKNIVINIRALSNKKKDPVNTMDDNENIYFFTADKEWELPKIYLYSQQKKIKHYGIAIDNILLDKFSESKQIHRDFIKYIASWSEGFLGGTYKLQKEDVALKLGDLLLSCHRKSPETFIPPKTESFSLWNTVVNSFDVTILKRNPAIIAKVCQPINSKIEQQLGIKIDTLTNEVHITQKVIANIKNPILKMFLFEEICLNQLDDDVPLDIIYLVFWKSGLVPMLLTAEDGEIQDYILCVIEFIKSLNAKRPYLLKTFEEKTFAIKTFTKSYKSLAFFITVDNLTSAFPEFVFDYTKISVSEALSATLNEIRSSDPFFTKHLTTNEFFDICRGNASFKPVDDMLRTRILEETNLTLDDDLMVKIREQIYSKKQASSSSQESISKCGLRGLDPSFFSV